MASRLVTTIPVNEVSRILGFSPQTIKNWYKWANSAYNTKGLYFPDPIRDEKGRMYFRQVDINKIRDFKLRTCYGMMKDFNNRYRKERR